MRVIALLVAMLGSDTLFMTDAELRVRNPTICAADGNLCVVVRENENIPDFGDAPASTEGDQPGATEYTAAVYERRQLISTMRVPAAAAQRHVTRQFFVTFTNYQEPLVRIQNLRGETVHVIAAKDVFAPRDLELFREDGYRLSSDVRTEGGREVLVVQLPGEEGKGEIAIDLESGKRIGPAVNAWPLPRVRAAEAGYLPLDLRHKWSPSRCIGTMAEPPAATRVSSAELLARAIERPLELDDKIKSLRKGTVFFDVTVSPNGTVLCTSAIAIPPGSHRFAIDDVLRGWTFSPARDPYRGELQIHFDVLTDTEFDAVQKRDANRAHH